MSQQLQLSALWDLPRSAGWPQHRGVCLAPRAPVVALPLGAQRRGHTPPVVRGKATVAAEVFPSTLPSICRKPLRCDGVMRRSASLCLPRFWEPQFSPLPAFHEAGCRSWHGTAPHDTRLLFSLESLAFGYLHLFLRERQEAEWIRAIYGYLRPGPYRAPSGTPHLDGDDTSSCARALSATETGQEVTRSAPGCTIPPGAVGRDQESQWPWGAGRQAGTPPASPAATPLPAFPTGGKSGAVLTEAPDEAERGQVPGQVCSIPAAAAEALILGMQGCVPEGGREGGRMQVKHFTVRGPVPRKTKKQVVPLNEHMAYKNTPPEEVYPLLFSHNTWLMHRVKC